MHGSELTRFVVGIIGNVISGLLFLSPAPTFWGVIKKKSTEEFHPYPYLATVMNCLLWVFYGLPFVHPNSILVITINSGGLALELVYLTIFIIYTPKAKYWGIIPLVLVGELGLLAAIATFTLLVFKTYANRSLVVGIICVIFGIIMYASPMSILKQVMKTKSAEFLPFWICVACFANGVVWFAYANIYSFDPFIATGNGIGGLLGLIQLCFWIYYTHIYNKRKPSTCHEEV